MVELLAACKQAANNIYWQPLFFFYAIGNHRLNVFFSIGSQWFFLLLAASNYIFFYLPAFFLQAVNIPKNTAC